MSERPIEEAKNLAYQLLAQAEADLEAGVIDEEEWYRRIAAVITPAYLAEDTPWGQSGRSGDGEATWEHARGLIADAVHRSGTFLDVGCASGYLMETMDRWCRDRGFPIEPYGLDIAPELAALARCRLSHWADRIFVGNGLTWQPPRRFDFARTGLEYVPARRQYDLIEHLLREVVVPGGRVIIGVYSEERDETRSEPSEEERVAAWGFRIAGRTDRPHYRDPRLRYRAFWIDAPG